MTHEVWCIPLDGVFTPAAADRALTALTGDTTAIINKLWPYFFAVAYISSFGGVAPIVSINSMRSGSARFMIAMQHELMSRPAVMKRPKIMS
jgi:hypothetical protein